MASQGILREVEGFVAGEDPSNFSKNLIPLKRVERKGGEEVPWGEILEDLGKG